MDWRSFAVGFLLFELSLNFEGLAFSLWVSQTLPCLALPAYVYKHRPPAYAPSRASLP